MAIAVVTGAARGIGHAIATRLAEDGFSVVATDIDAALVVEAAVAWRAAGLDVAGHGLDVRDRVAVAALFDTLGEIDVLVNNAGVAAPMVGLEELSDAELRRVFAVNVTGCFIVAQEGVRRMGDGGRVINIASRGYLGGAGGAHYVASKAAVVGLTRAMAIELRWAGITVNAVAPGMVETRMLADYTPQMRQAAIAREPTGAPADPAEIAASVAFLASPGAGFVNGLVMMTDGGKTVGMPPL